MRDRSLRVLVRVLLGIGEQVARLGDCSAALPIWWCGRIPWVYAPCVVVVVVEFLIYRSLGGDDTWIGDEELRDHGARGQDAAGGDEEDDVDKACQ